jgi:hypothetical protein
LGFITPEADAPSEHLEFADWDLDFIWDLYIEIWDLNHDIIKQIYIQTKAKLQ